MTAKRPKPLFSINPKKAVERCLTLKSNTGFMFYESQNMKRAQNVNRCCRDCKRPLAETDSEATARREITIGVQRNTLAVVGDLAQLRIIKSAF